MLDKIKAGFGSKMFSTIIHVNVKLKEAQNEGLHILNYDKYCRGAKDYLTIAREIISAEQPVAAAAPAAQTLEKEMREILKKELPKMKAMVFSLSAPEAKEVYLAGDFNGWQLNADSRMEVKSGNWVKYLNLNPGFYRYRFVIDGEWIEDPANPQKEMNPYGKMDSLIEV
jgi:hypothetical protein